MNTKNFPYNKVWFLIVLYIRLPGIMSHAMVMCASTPEKVEILDPPPSSKPGDKVTVEGFSGTPDQQLNPKKKVNCVLWFVYYANSFNILWFMIMNKKNEVLCEYWVSCYD